MELERQSLAVLQQFGRTYRAYAAAFEQRIGHPLPRWRILYALHGHAGPIAQKPLADRVGMDPGALTRQLKALQELGWVERNTSERDNRVTNVTLSELGRGIVEQALPLRSSFLQDVLENVSETTMRNLSKGLEQLESGIAVAVQRTQQQEKADAADAADAA
ncbi:MarR family winged helix-turn-helix transcriptional regulator [Cupriavidus sp. 30B13]|uniref:MarR family winged helix-turn-helix transcriptional regulator n=1 Tax=Cupriavidus sp. 30B13 TaxID=3384241 RepID=UPI003B90AD68